MTTQRNIRLHIESHLEASKECELSLDKSHYLCNVMRCKEGDVISCFNENDGEFISKIVKIDKKRTIIEAQSLKKAPQKESDIWLLFAPLKKENTDFVIEKSTELGVGKIIPVITRFTNSDKIRLSRFISQAIEASEQCERMSVPKIEDATKLKSVLENWNKTRTIFFMNERREATSIINAFSEHSNKPAALLIGPEGGFSDDEAQYITKFPFVKSVSLGPRILRAETAAISALAVWQATVGDWN